MKHLQILSCLILTFMVFSPVKAEENDSLKIASARIEQVTKDYYVNLDYYDKYPSYERLVDRSNHLHGWSKFCKVYGIIAAGIGGFDLGLGISDGDGYCITMGAICLAQGLVVAKVGDSLRKHCDVTREEIMRINSVGFPTSEIKFNDKTLTPSLNLMTDNFTHDKALGVGFSLSF